MAKASNEEKDQKPTGKKSGKASASGEQEELFVLQEFRDIVDFDIKHTVGKAWKSDDDKRTGELKEAGLIGNKTKLNAIQGVSEEEENPEESEDAK